MEVDDDVEDDPMDFLRSKGSPSETSSNLTSEAECEVTSFENQPSTEVYLPVSPGNKNTADSALPRKRIPAKGVCEEIVPESTSAQLYRENGEGRVNGLGREPLQAEASFSPSVPNSHPLLVEASEEDAISRQKGVKCALVNYALKELETFLQESDDEADLKNVDEEQEYRKFLAAVLSGEGDDTQACQGGETQDEDENDAELELIFEGGLESNGDENVENYESINGTNEKDAHRPRTTKKRPKLSRAVNRNESTKYNLRSILPNRSSVPLAPQNASHNINVPSISPSVNSASVVEGFTDEQLGQLHMMIYEHVQLMIQTFSLSVLNPSKLGVATDVKKMIIELVGYRDEALARRNTIHRQFCFERQHLKSALSHASSESSQHQWTPLIRNPVMSILDVSPLHLALSYLSDVAAGKSAKYGCDQFLILLLFILFAIT